MGRIGKDLLLELVMQRIEEKKISQTKLAQKLGLTKYALNKILKGKQKMYLHEFIELSYELNLLYPKLTRPFEDELISRMDISSIRRIVERKLSGSYEYQRIENKYNKALASLKHKTEIIEEIDGIDWEMVEDVIEQLNAYLKEECTEDNIRIIEDDDFRYDYYSTKFCYLIKLINDRLNSNNSPFDMASYIEYQQLKKSAYMIENQYVFKFPESE